MVSGLGELGQTIASAIKAIVLQIIELLTPVINIIGIAMIVTGIILALGFRQEYLGIRLAISGALSLATVHLIIPMLLAYI